MNWSRLSSHSLLFPLLALAMSTAIGESVPLLTQTVNVKVCTLYVANYLHYFDATTSQYTFGACGSFSITQNDCVKLFSSAQLQELPFWYVSEYFCSREKATFPQLYDTLINLSGEIALIWLQRWSIGKILYIVTRYSSFLDAGLLLWCQQTHSALLQRLPL